MFNILDQFSPSSIKMKVICNITFIFILSVGILNTIYAKPFGHSAIGASGYKKRVNMNDFLKKRSNHLQKTSANWAPRRILVPPDYHAIFEFKEKLARKVGIFFNKFLTSLGITHCIYFMYLLM